MLTRYFTGSLFPASKLQWAPTLTSHDPNPPLPLESEAATGAGVGSAAGSSTVAGIGAATTAASGSAAGSGAATGVSAATAASVGAAAGSSTVSGVGVSVAASTGLASGASTAEAIGASTGGETPRTTGAGAFTPAEQRLVLARFIALALKMREMRQFPKREDEPEIDPELEDIASAALTVVTQAETGRSAFSQQKPFKPFVAQYPSWALQPLQSKINGLREKTDELREKIDRLIQAREEAEENDIETLALLAA